MYSEYRFDQPWDSDANFTIDTRPLPSKRIVIETGDMAMQPHGMPYPYRCEYNFADHNASYLMLVGNNAFGKPQGWRTQSEIVDGLDSTIAVAETIRSDIHWLSPVDLDVATMSFTVNDGPNSISSRHPRGPAVLFCDGEVFRLNPSIDPDTLKALVTIDGGENISRDQLLDIGLLVSP
jgi:hypothetical protein